MVYYKLINSYSGREVMSENVFQAGTNLVIISHPHKGDGVNGRSICAEIRRKLEGTTGQVCLYHDASAMSTANTAYAGEFKTLDKEISSRVIEVVCAIPGSIPRMMAHTVAMLSDKKWSIFKTADEATAYLTKMGYTFSASAGARSAAGSAVSLKVLR